MHVAMEEDLYKTDNLDRLEEDDLSFVLQEIDDSQVTLDSTNPQHQCIRYLSDMIIGDVYKGNGSGNSLEQFLAFSKVKTQNTIKN